MIIANTIQYTVILALRHKPPFALQRGILNTEILDTALPMISQPFALWRGFVHVSDCEWFSCICTFLLNRSLKSTTLWSIIMTCVPGLYSTYTEVKCTVQARPVIGPQYKTLFFGFQLFVRWHHKPRWKCIRICGHEDLCVFPAQFHR